MKPLVSIFTIILLPVISWCATIYVPDDYPTIQDAINAACDYEEIIVRPGIYYENIDFLGKNIEVESEKGPEVTTIDGKQSGSVVTMIGVPSWPGKLEGFTITNGTGRPSKSLPYTAGGGIYVEGSYPIISSPSISNNIITGNTAAMGGGISCFYGSSAGFANNVISHNAAEDGGGIWCYFASPGIYDNVITGNSAISISGTGGGISCAESSAIISGNIISSNLASTSGGGIRTIESSTVIRNNRIEGNSAHVGGGICCYNSYYVRGEITGNIIIENIADHGGGIRCSKTQPLISGNYIGFNEGGGFFCGRGSSQKEPLVFTNNIVCNNWGDTRYSGINCDFSDIVIINCTISGNANKEYGGGLCSLMSNVTVINTIFWDNDAPVGPEISLDDSTLNIDFSDVEGGKAVMNVDPDSIINWGQAVLDSDPLFVDPKMGDCHLPFTSPCRDAGTIYTVLSSEDFEGDPRIADSSIDMGADEFYYHLYHTGDVIPGNSLKINVVGSPGLSSVRLLLGSGIEKNPQSTPYGDLFLSLPIRPFDLGAMPSSGVLVTSKQVPSWWQSSEEYPFQAMVGPMAPGSVLTNLMVLTVE